jgi:hypothetical protein
VLGRRIQSLHEDTAGIAHSIVFDVMEPLYKKHPLLKPNNWDEERSLPK